MAAEKTTNFGPRRTAGAYDARAQRNPGGRVVVRYRTRGDASETSVSLSPQDAEKLAAVLVAAACDARGLGGENDR